LLSAIAAATTTIRIGAVALISPLRNPLSLASDFATLDLISHGRLVVQQTVAWHKDEYLALGVPFHERGKILSEQLEIFSLLWSGSPTTFHGDYF
jgi:alkanesulfonate monooxygenase SsuD/methylene tetrahydromethanopterin reductase-like flavin-dependent oxidoreductase (luciferase family)